MRSSVFTLFPPVVRGTLVLTGRSRHCRITAGLASMDMTLLVSLLSLSAGGAVRGFYRASWLARGSPPTSPVALLLAFRNGAPSGSLLRVFRFKSSRWGHPSGSGLSQSSIGSKALAPPSWCMVRVFAMGPPCRVVVCSRSRSKRRLVGAPSLVVGVLPSRWGHPF